MRHLLHAQGSIVLEERILGNTCIIFGSVFDQMSIKSFDIKVIN